MMYNNIQINFQNHYVLAVEDSMLQAKRLQRFFDENNINATICKTGVEALEAAKNRKPLLIISDIIMPEMDGYTFCSKVKTDPELSDVPVILLTSLSDPLDIVKGLQAGADNFITKPYDDDYLMTRINYLIANRQVRQMGSDDVGIEIVFQGQNFQINSDKKQILNLLLSVYEAAVNRNEHLIEARRELEKSNEELQAANKELDAFSQTVSHDLKSPLTSVMGFAELLKSDYEDILDDRAHAYLENIIRSAGTMAKLIEDLLAFSRSGRAKITPDVVNISDMARSIINELREVSYQGEYTIHIEEDIMVNADPGLMRVVLTNLIGNALKYSQKKDNPEVTIGRKQGGQQTAFYIQDNGEGFDMNKADDIFRPFIRLHVNNEFQGTGVGLSTVKRIIDRHGGAIWFDSAPGEGTTFYIAMNGQ
ncbi:MAG: response regulator [Bacteroidales bacterium]